MYKTKKHFGQNFLHDQAIIEKIIHAIKPQKHERMLEIGPGLGALSEQVLEQVEKLYLVEIDNDLIPKLEKLFAQSEQENWQIFHQDALSFKFSQLESNTQKTRVVGNLPYNISTPLLFRFIDQIDFIQDMHFMLQKEVVDRLCAEPNNKSYGRLSIMLQYYCQCEHLFDVAPECFSPAPKVNSAIIRLMPYETLPHPCDDVQQLSRLLSTAFAQRRKTLGNNLKKLNINEHLEALDIDRNLRAENIDLAQYVQLCNSLQASGIIL